MKALFYGGAVASVAGLLMGMGMELSPQPPQQPDDIQPAIAQAETPAPESVAYASSQDAYPLSYVIDASYTGEPVTRLRPEVDPADQPATYQEPASYDEPGYDENAINQILKTAWKDAAKAPRVTPQDVAAAGDTSAPTEPTAQTGTRTYASIDALLNQQQIDRARGHVPS